MDREKILKLAREHDLHCFGNITEYSLFGEAIVEFAAAIRAATKEEDAMICDDVGMFNELSAASGLAFQLADAIRASK